MIQLCTYLPNHPKGMTFLILCACKVITVILCGWWFYDVVLMGGSMVWRQQMNINGTGSSVCESRARFSPETYSSSNDVREMTSGVRWWLSNESSIQAEFRYLLLNLWPLNPGCSCCLSLETTNWALMYWMESAKTPKVMESGLNWLGVP